MSAANAIRLYKLAQELEVDNSVIIRLLQEKFHVPVISASDYVPSRYADQIRGLVRVQKASKVHRQT